MRTRLGLIFVSVLVLAILVTGSPVSAQPKVLVVAVPSEPSHIDPSDSMGVQRDLNYHIYRKLYTFTPEMMLEPDLVASDRVSSDQKTWTFDLKRGITFFDGTPVNAAAVKYSIDRMLEPGRKAPMAICSGRSRRRASRASTRSSWRRRALRVPEEQPRASQRGDHQPEGRQGARHPVRMRPGQRGPLHGRGVGERRQDHADALPRVPGHDALLRQDRFPCRAGGRDAPGDGGAERGPGRHPDAADVREGRERELGSAADPARGDAAVLLLVQPREAAAQRPARPARAEPRGGPGGDHQRRGARRGEPGPQRDGEDHQLQLPGG